MPRLYGGPKYLSRDKPAPTARFLSVGAKTLFGVWTRGKRDPDYAEMLRRRVRHDY